ncbi:hypothetical protein Hte_008849 [Hypoxylon texense]
MGNELDNRVAAVAQSMKNIYQDEFIKVYQRIKAVSDAVDGLVGQDKNHAEERARGVETVLDSRTGDLNARMDDLEKRMDERVAKLEERINELAGKLDVGERPGKLLDSKKKTTTNPELVKQPAR